jgi:hypothetical protein
VTHDDHFTRLTVNRVWSFLMGRGLVEPVDDFNQRNRPVSKDLMEALVAESRSLKAIVRAICGSDAYRRSCGGDDAEDHRLGRASIRPLSGEQLLNSILVATTGMPGADLGEARAFSAGLATGPLSASEVTLLPAGAAHVMWLRNSDRIWKSIRNGAVVGRIRASAVPLEEKVDQLFLAVLSRRPTEKERARYADYLRPRGAEAFEDACWTLLNTFEFMTRN